VNDVVSGANLVYGGPTTSFVADRLGNVNSAVYLNQGYYTAPSGVYFTGDHTVAVWVKVIGFANWARIMDFGKQAGIFQALSDNIFLSISNSGSPGHPSTTVYNAGSHNTEATSNLALQLNVWTHLAYTYSSGTCKIYLNAALTASASCLAPRNINRASCLVGKSNFWSDGALNAHIDELRIYSRSLDITEINELVFGPPTSASTLFLGSTSSTDSISTTPILTLTNTSPINSFNAATAAFVSTTSISTSTVNDNTPSTSAIATSSISSISSSESSLSIASSFYFSQLNPLEMMSLLASSYDLSGCVVNCSNNGICGFDSTKNDYLCTCYSVYMIGNACQIDTRACSSSPCLHNGTCIEYSNMTQIEGSNSSLYYCLCDELHKGTNCELKVNVCQNETCSNNGYCYDSDNEPKCECFSMYSGDKCETESSELKVVKKVISISSILAFVMIIFTYSCIGLMDIAKFCCKKKAKRQLRPKAIKFTYIN
jgi:hypothetical protein